MREQAHKAAANEQEQPEVAVEQEETEATTRFAGGQVPPVGGGFDQQTGTAELAFEEDGKQRELKDKVNTLVNKWFGGDYKKAFTHYDRDGDGAVGKSELVDMLSDAGVGNGLTRGTWASKIIERLDTDRDRGIQWSEFESVFRARA